MQSETYFCINSVCTCVDLYLSVTLHALVVDDVLCTEIWRF